MPSGAVVHAAVFAVGAIVGGGLATAVAARKRDALSPTTARPPVPAQTVPQNPPVLDVRKGEDARAVMKPPPGMVMEVDHSVLKYGHPGTSDYLCTGTEQLRSNILVVGPVSDLLVRRAYITAYDRRLRHPAWVCPSLLENAIQSTETPVCPRQQST